MAKQSPKRADKQIPYCDDQGMSYLAGAGVPGVSIQQKQVVQAGASPFAVTFAALGLPDMADSSYSVVCGGETVGAPKVTQSTVTPTGFSIAGGANGETLHLIIAGRIKGQVGPNGV